MSALNTRTTALKQTLFLNDPESAVTLSASDFWKLATCSLAFVIVSTLVTAIVVWLR